jgi:lipopolysaccharide transport system permease protein
MTEEIIDSSKRNLLDLKELWRHRELFYFFTWRDLKVKYKQTVLGFMWAVLQPLLMTVIFSLFFGRALNVPSQGLPYPVFVLSGLIVWNLFSSGLTSAATSMVNNFLVIKKIYFPRLVIPVSAVLIALFDFAIAFIFFIGVLLYYNQSVSWLAVIYWPLSVAATVVATLGLGCWMSALNVKYRDIRYVIPFFVQLLFFLSPVIFPVSLLKYPALQYILVTSPLYAAIELFRSPLIGVTPDLYFISISLSSAVVLLVIGLVYFKRTESHFADFA